MSFVRQIFKFFLCALTTTVATQARADSVTIQGYCGTWMYHQPECYPSYTLEQDGDSFTDRIGDMLFDVAYRDHSLIISAKQEVPASFDLINGAYSLHFNVYDASQPIIPDHNFCGGRGGPLDYCFGNKLANFTRSSYPRHLDQPLVLALRSPVPEPSAWLLMLVGGALLAIRRHANSSQASI